MKGSGITRGSWAAGVVAMAAGLWCVLAGCRHTNAENWENAERLARLISQDRNSRKLQALEKEIKTLRAQLDRKNKLLGKLAALAGGKKDADGSRSDAAPSGPASNVAPPTQAVPRPAAPRKAVPRTTPAPRRVPSVYTHRAGALWLRVLQYKDWKMVVEVYNPDAAPRVFRSRGLYFVPVGDSRKAPQRLGAAGPYEIWKSGTWQPVRTAAAVQPRARMKARLHVFCLDRGRRTPFDGTRFRVARGRLPSRLQKGIDRGLKPILRGGSFRRRPKARRAAQRHIWRMRDAISDPLDGE